MTAATTGTARRAQALPAKARLKNWSDGAQRLWLRFFAVLNTLDFSPGLDTKRWGEAGEGIDDMGGRNAHIDSSQEMAIGAAAHDILHFAGIQDGPRDASGKRTSSPNPGYDDTNIMSSRAGTKLNPDQINEAKTNRSTKHCVVKEDGKTECR
jgi:hypothetical protein